jgi:hypothetical protein
LDAIHPVLMGIFAFDFAWLNQELIGNPHAVPGEKRRLEWAYEFWDFVGVCRRNVIGSLVV